MLFPGWDVIELKLSPTEATALHHGLTMVTRHTADFALFGVPLLNPWENE